MLAGLANDAAGLLFELAAMQDSGDAAKEMLTKSEQLQVSIVQGSATALLAAAVSLAIVELSAAAYSTARQIDFS